MQSEDTGKSDSVPACRKVLLVVWKWAITGSKGQPLVQLDDRAWETENLNMYIDHTQEGEGVFYDVFPAEPSLMSSGARVVAATIINVGERSRPLLDTLINEYATEENELIVMLHRGNFYTEEDVDHILTKFGERITSCFLFANGRDYIYYQTQQSGLLDDIGNFYSGWIPGTGNKVETFDGQHVKQPYFDRVWDYYRSEFELKVFQLKEELMEAWLPFLLPGASEKTNTESLIEALSSSDYTSRVLYYRTKSFANQYAAIKTLDVEKDFERLHELTKERKSIEKFERASGESFLFDDCIQNLMRQRKTTKVYVNEAYQEVLVILHNMLFKDQKQQVTQADIRHLLDKFNYLVKIIPGELD